MSKVKIFYRRFEPGRCIENPLVSILLCLLFEPVLKHFLKIFTIVIFLLSNLRYDLDWNPANDTQG